MKAELLDGKKLSQKILNELKDDIAKMNKQIKLGIVVVGNDPASAAYVEKKKKIGKDLSVEVKVYNYPADISTKKLREQINKAQRAPNMEGIIVQLPLPEHINTQSVLNAVVPEKDVDVLGAKAVGKFYTSKSPTNSAGRPIAPPAAAGIMRLLSEYNIKLKGKSAVVVGYGRLVGRPVSHLLKTEGAAVTIVDENTKNISAFTKKADIIVSGAGKPNLITKDIIKAGAVVIDAGTSAGQPQTTDRRPQKTKIVGDAGEDVKEIAGYITPVPGGVGPMTVAMLFWNLVQLTKR